MARARPRLIGLCVVGQRGWCSHATRDEPSRAARCVVDSPGVRTCFALCSGTVGALSGILLAVFPPAAVEVARADRRGVAFDHDGTESRPSQEKSGLPRHDRQL